MSVMMRTVTGAMAALLAGWMVVAPVVPADAATHVFSKAPTPVIGGSAAVGKTLAAKPGTWKPKPATLKFQWLRGGKAIKGATKKTYLLLPADAGNKITVKVTGSRPGYRTTSKTSVPTAKVAASAGAVRGKVVGDDHPSAGLAGITVTAYRWNASKSSASATKTTTTSTAGTYALSGLAPGVYSVRFGGNDAYNPEWYDDTDTLGTARKLTVAAGKTLTANGSLPPKATTEPADSPTIAGMVTGDDAPGVGLAGFEVRLFKFGAEDPVADTLTDSAGGYRFEELSSTTNYYLEFFGGDGYASEWYDDASGPYEAETKAIKPPADQVTRANASLAPGGTVAGTITGNDGEGAIAGERLILCPYVGGAPSNCLAGGYTGPAWSSDPWAQIGTGEDGAYSLTVPTGDYTGYVTGARSGPQGFGWQGGWAAGNGVVRDVLAEAGTLHVLRNQTITLNPVDYPHQATIHGTITTPHAETGYPVQMRYCTYTGGSGLGSCSAETVVAAEPVEGSGGTEWTYQATLINGDYHVYFVYLGTNCTKTYDQPVDCGVEGTALFDVLTIHGEDIDYGFDWP
jgi:hypothetical protein